MNLSEVTQKDLDELEKHRKQKKKLSDYHHKYEQERYKRIICLFPKSESDLLEKAKGDVSISSYVVNLIHEDMEKKGLI